MGPSEDGSIRPGSTPQSGGSRTWVRTSTRPRAASSRPPVTSPTTTRLKKEGKLDELGGKVKGAVEDLKDKAEDAVDKVKDKHRRDRREPVRRAAGSPAGTARVRPSSRHDHHGGAARGHDPGPGGAPARHRRVRSSGRAGRRVVPRHAGGPAADPRGGPAHRRPPRGSASSASTGPGVGPVDRPPLRRLVDFARGRGDRGRPPRDRALRDDRPLRRRPVRAGHRLGPRPTGCRRSACSAAWCPPAGPTRCGGGLVGVATQVRAGAAAVCASRSGILLTGFVRLLPSRSGKQML